MKKIIIDKIQKIKSMIQDGIKVSEIARALKIYPNVVIYYTNPAFRDRLRKYNRERYRNMSPKQKKEYINKRRDYQKNYHKKRYKLDKQFREKQIEYAKKYQNKNYKRKK
jgi:hypothetical protein